MVLHHTLTIGALIAFFLYLNRFFQPIQLLVQQYNTFQQGQASIIKLRTLLDTEPTVTEAADAVELPPIDGEIVFDDVSFGYDPDVPVIHDVDLRIAPGETVAFVGPTGAGKSTLAKLVTRFYDPTGGRVLIDGHDLRGVTLALAAPPARRGAPGAVPLRRHHPRQHRLRPARGAGRGGVGGGAHGRAGRADRPACPTGSTRWCTSAGQSLSSGERQLIALARAFLAHPRVLVLDEATSNLDLQSETKIESALDVLLEDRTAVLIAHRLSTAMRADRIVVVDDGRSVEVGTHEELVARGGRYAEMYATWIRQAHQDDRAPAGSQTAPGP